MKLRNLDHVKLVEVLSGPFTVACCQCGKHTRKFTCPRCNHHTCTACKTVRRAARQVPIDELRCVATLLNGSRCLYRSRFASSCCGVHWQHPKA